MFCCFRGKKEDEGPKRMKMVIVGDGDCGKTCLLYRFAHGEFFTRYIPTVFEVEAKTVYYKEKEIQLVMYDTAGQEDYDRLRPFSYEDTDIMVICFSLDNPDSLDNVLLNWLPEVRYFCGKVPILLVGTKKDLRLSQHDAKLKIAHTDSIEAAMESATKRFSAVKTSVSSEEGAAVASKMDAVGYFETSAMTGEGIDRLFEAVIRTGMEIKVKNRRSIFRVNKKKLKFN